MVIEKKSTVFSTGKNKSQFMTNIPSEIVKQMDLKEKDKLKFIYNGKILIIQKED